MAEPLLTLDAYQREALAAQASRIGVSVRALLVDSVWRATHGPSLIVLEPELIADVRRAAAAESKTVSQWVSARLREALAPSDTPARRKWREYLFSQPDKAPGA